MPVRLEKDDDDSTSFNTSSNSGGSSSSGGRWLFSIIIGMILRGLFRWLFKRRR